MNNKKQIKRLIRFEFCDGNLTNQDSDLNNSLWVHSVNIEIPSTEKNMQIKQSYYQSF